jgi:hypothetical protein
MQFTVDTFVQVSLDTVGVTNPRIRCACGQKLNMNRPACHEHSVQESTAVVGPAERPLDQSRASCRLQEPIRNINLHRVLESCFNTVSIIRYLGILGQSDAQTSCQGAVQDLSPTWRGLRRISPQDETLLRYGVV